MKEVNNQVCGQVWDQVGNQVWPQVDWQVGNQVWPQVYYKLFVLDDIYNKIYLQVPLTNDKKIV